MFHVESQCLSDQFPNTKWFNAIQVKKSSLELHAVLQALRLLPPFGTQFRHAPALAEPLREENVDE